MTSKPAATLVLPAEALALALDDQPGYRVLRRVRPMFRDVSAHQEERVLVGCAIDVATTGSDHRQHRIIELALQRVWADSRGRITATGRRRSWLEDPLTDITPEITASTGLSVADVAGRSIVDAEAASLIADADFVVAHDAWSLRPFVEARLPFAKGGRWVCSMWGLDWTAHGYRGRDLRQLLSQMGWFHEELGAQAGVDALLRLLDGTLVGESTVLKELVTQAARPTWLVEAVGAHADARNMLEERGYRWSSDARVWVREVDAWMVREEVEWLTLEIYGGLREPACREVTWTERYAAVPAAGVVPGLARRR